MNGTTVPTIHNPAILRQLGIEALVKALGPAGMVHFMRQFDMGSGNDTEERDALLSGITIEDFEWFQKENAK
jgi:hypothetical protein